MRNYYEVLGVETTATREEIEHALLDKIIDDSENIELYAQIHRLLLNPEAKKEYDEELRKSRQYEVRAEVNIPQPVYGPPKKEEYEVHVIENIPQPVYGPPKKEEYEVHVMRNIPQPVYGPPQRSEVYEVRVEDNHPQPVYGPPRRK